MKNYIIVFLSILLFLALFFASTFYSRGEHIKNVANYDINKEHLMMQESGDYDYCPYCGEYLGETDVDHKTEKKE